MRFHNVRLKRTHRTIGTLSLMGLILGVILLLAGQPHLPPAEAGPWPMTPRSTTPSTIMVFLPLIARRVPALIAFVSNRDGNQEIYAVTADGLASVNLSNHEADDELPAWSPQGSRIAFASNRTGNWDIWVMNADGANPVNVTNHPAEDSFPAWSPDGSRLAFHSDRDGNSEIYVLNVQDALQGTGGRSLQRLTDNDADDWWPAWSPDGTQIAFGVLHSESNVEIYVTNVDGSGRVRLTSNSAFDAAPAYQP